MIIVPTVAMALRFYVRVKRKLPWLANDLLALSALVSNIRCFISSVIDTVQVLCIGLCIEIIICKCPIDRPVFVLLRAKHWAGMHYGVGKHVIATNPATAYKIIQVCHNR